MIIIDSIREDGVLSGLKQVIIDNSIQNIRCTFVPGQFAEIQEFGFSEAQTNLVNAMWTPEVIQNYQNSITE